MDSSYKTHAMADKTKNENQFTTKAHAVTDTTKNESQLKDFHIKKTLRLLLVEDSESDAELIIRLLKRAGFDLSFKLVQTNHEMTETLNNHHWDIVLSDYNLPQFDALSALNVLHATGKDIPFIVVSGAIGEDTAVAIMKAGAHDYVMKDNLPRLIPAIERELREAELRHQKIKTEQEQKNLEEQLRQAQKMEAVGQLAGGVAHDFNNMLFIITGCTELMMETIPPDNPAYQNLDMIMGAAQRATNLVRQLLLFSRKSARKPVIIDMNEIIINLMKMIRRVIGENIKLEFMPGFNLNNICADPGQMEQVLMNLCINARDAMPDGGKIVIETQNVFIQNEFSEVNTVWKNNEFGKDEGIFFNDCNTGAKKGCYVLLTISDTGCGIPRELHKRVFEPFFTTKDVGKGTGMGLAAVYGIVRSHEGMINLYSEAGKGTVFKIYIPSSEKVTSCMDETNTDIKIFNGNREIILVAEDEEIVRKMLVKILEGANYQVIAAENGEQAIDLFKQNSKNIDIALLDVVMPVMGGDKVMEYIRQTKPELPIIFLTGYSRGMLPKNILSQTNYDTIQKPVSRFDMLSKISKVLGT
ncbi:MAG: response regulator [Desulfamplus sp.]|nr:response regulator [Desulfamplus sp.]